jgi:hypothetical protein
LIQPFHLLLEGRMSRFAIFMGLSVLLMGSIVSGLAESYLLVDGSTLEGEPVAFGSDGVAFKKPDGTFSERVGWTNFTQAALKKLAALPKAQPFLESYLEPDEPAAKKPTPEIKLRPVPRLPRPDPKAGIGGLFSSSLSLVILLIIYCGNIYGGYEIAIFRNYPVALVCALSAIAPVLGPVIFLSLPTRPPVMPGAVRREQEEEEEELEVIEQAAPAPAGPAPSRAQSFSVPSSGGASAGAASAAPATSAPRQPATIYQRGQTTFNRRFFETKLSGFLRIVPSESEKDLILVIRSARGEHSGQRVSRIMPNELCLLVQKGGASAEVIIPYAEIQEVQVRHRDS